MKVKRRAARGKVARFRAAKLCRPYSKLVIFKLWVPNRLSVSLNLPVRTTKIHESSLGLPFAFLSLHDMVSRIIKEMSPLDLTRTVFASMRIIFRQYV